MPEDTIRAREILGSDPILACEQAVPARPCAQSEVAVIPLPDVRHPSTDLAKHPGHS
jgi:hypothetical protein